MELVLLLTLFGVLVAWWVGRSWGTSSPAQQPPSLLPKVGAMLSGEFVHRSAPIHFYCRVEENEESRLLVRVLSELGKSPLLGMRAGTPGQLKVGDQWLPIEVLNVSLPWVVVEAFAGSAKPTRRESIRVPASFSVRFRAQGLTHGWTGGKGINVSAGGFCFSAGFTRELRVGRMYEVELSPDDDGQGSESFVFLAEVRWLLRTDQGTVCGLQLAERAKQPDLARLVLYLQQRMGRHPEDYLLETNPKPDLAHGDEPRRK